MMKTKTILNKLNDGKFFTLETKAGRRYVARVRPNYRVDDSRFTVENVRKGSPVTILSKNVKSISRGLERLV